MKPWWQNNDTEAVLSSAFQSMQASKCWKTETSGSNTTAVAAAGGLYPYSYLAPNSQTLFPFTDFITTSFWPMIEKQFESSAASRTDNVLRYFEALHGEAVDSDLDGIVDSYRYNSNASSIISRKQAAIQPAEDIGDYSIWATSNLLVGMLMPTDNLSFLEELVTGNPFYKSHSSLPKVGVFWYYIDIVNRDG
jgi:hypothetical protein